MYQILLIQTIPKADRGKSLLPCEGDNVSSLLNCQVLEILWMMDGDISFSLVFQHKYAQVLFLTVLQCYKYTEDGFCFNQTTQGKREQGEKGVSGVFSIKLPASFELKCRKLLSNSNSCRWVFSSLLWGAQVSNERTCKVLGIHSRLEHLATGTILTFLNFLDLSCEANFGIWPFQLRLAELIKRPNPELSFKASLFPQPPPAKMPFKHIYYLKMGFVKYKYGIR